MRFLNRKHLREGQRRTCWGGRFPESEAEVGIHCEDRRASVFNLSAVVGCRGLMTESVKREHDKAAGLAHFALPVTIWQGGKLACAKRGYIRVTANRPENKSCRKCVHALVLHIAGLVQRQMEFVLETKDETCVKCKMRPLMIEDFPTLQCGAVYPRRLTPTSARTTVVMDVKNPPRPAKQAIYDIGNMNTANKALIFRRDEHCNFPYLSRSPESSRLLHLTFDIEASVGAIESLSRIVHIRPVVPGSVGI